MARKKLANQLEAAYGVAPDVEYFDEDMAGIRTYYAYRRDNSLDFFYVDDTTWRDLSMDDVYKRINNTQSTSGEQYLYYMLRTPATDEAQFAKRQALIGQMEEKPSLRRKLQAILARLGKSRAANTQEAFKPARESPWWCVLTIVLVLLLVGSIAGLFFSSAFRVPLLVCLLVNAVFHTMMLHRIQRDMHTMNYSVAMVRACRKMQRLDGFAGQGDMQAFFEAGSRARPIVRQGGIAMTMTSDLATYFNLFFMGDLISYFRLRNRLGKYHKEIFMIHEALGMIDAAIAIASYHKSVNTWCLPAIDFAATAPHRLNAQGLVHPLVKNPVANDLAIDQPLLITGSNASGKSTFLKAVALNAILAQGICTALCKAYAATAFRIYTSMAIADNVLAGDSYFIAEIKSIHRIVQAAAEGGRILCVIDEVLRGTNTVERIAASSELLKSLADADTLCLAATHDGELCTLLPMYRQAHFEERLVDDEVLFDYLLKGGPATTRNAIRLLSILGFDDGLVSRAEAAAQHYLQTGEWTSKPQ